MRSCITQATQTNTNVLFLPKPHFLKKWLLWFPDRVGSVLNKNLGLLGGFVAFEKASFSVGFRVICEGTWAELTELAA